VILQSFPPMSVYQRSTPWWQGYPALAMSDTSESRDPNYHRTTDTADKLNYEEMARLADGFICFVQVLAASETTLSRGRMEFRCFRLTCRQCRCPCTLLFHGANQS